ncbi:MAG: NAD(P)/FAD-dependent oxidoreductase [Candidatus Nezhaarchaeota archaeon]|nr:NAD(P)/FAD-dependent oxidoreductase [Candidatus Nezhaarchaeota archaeon]MCX8142396.1 NAD(P)/FAD-dependent oxidoreductase [Candidatus Nezhaarchaeota archaeon]MDW8050631.1 NAD(P)/FAD-dependent oxidoreductase [Nitrososphaerota archaeon]
MKILESIWISNVKIPNRIVLPAMAMNMAKEGYVTRDVMEHYTKFARNGVGLIIVEGASIDPKAKDLHGGLGIHSDKFCIGLNSLAEEIKLHGSACGIQFLHPGGCATPRVEGNEPAAPSALEYTMFMHGRHAFKAKARELSREEIKRLIELFTEAAGRAKDCGFDFVEINAAHGWLFSQFLSPNTNKRTDEYGGQFENRIRFSLEVLESIKKNVGIPIIFRIDGSFPSYGGVSDEEIVRYAVALERAGVDCLHVSGSLAITPMIIKRGLLLEGAFRVKSAVKVPVIGVGGISARMAVELIEEDKLDLVALGRALLADPDLVVKLKEGRIEDIRPCVRCNDCIDMLFSLRQFKAKCSINPEVKIEKTETPKRIVVVGGGPAGMEFARIARMRGHDVVIVEKSQQLGGNLIAASAPRFKSDLREYLDWLKRKLGDVKLLLNTEATTESIKGLRPDIVVVAIGSEHEVPPIPGIERAVKAVDVLVGRAKVEGKVVILGGGRIGCETALHLAEDGKEVAILEVLPDIALDLERNYRYFLIRELRSKNVKWMCNFKTERIEENKVIGYKDGARVEVDFDSLVLAAGMRSRTLKLDVDAPCYHIGDCVKPGKLRDAIYQAAYLASRI